MCLINRVALSKDSSETPVGCLTDTVLFLAGESAVAVPWSVDLNNWTTRPHCFLQHEKLWIQTVSVSSRKVTGTGTDPQFFFTSRSFPASYVKVSLLPFLGKIVLLLFLSCFLPRNTIGIPPKPAFPPTLIELLTYIFGPGPSALPTTQSILLSQPFCCY